MKKFSYKIFLVLCFFMMLLPRHIKAGQNSFEIDYEVSSYTYKEPHMAYPISLKGTKQGFSATYKRYNLWQTEIPNSNFILLEMRYMTGDNTYNGWLSSGGIYVPTEADNIADYYWEGALKAGRLIYSKENFNIEGSLGIGYRNLRDHLEDMGPGGYLRKSTYIYMPVDMVFKYQLNNRFNLALKTEFDFLVSGQQYSGPIVGYESMGVYNSQEQGYGLRASLKLSTTAGFAEFFIEPFWRYWQIQNSDEAEQYIKIGGTWYEQVVYEPFNTTQEYGVKVGVKF